MENVRSLLVLLLGHYSWLYVLFYNKIKTSFYSPLDLEIRVVCDLSVVKCVFTICILLSRIMYNVCITVYVTYILSCN